MYTMIWCNYNAKLSIMQCTSLVSLDMDRYRWIHWIVPILYVSEINIFIHSFSNFLACSYLFCTDLLNPLYSHHPSHILMSVLSSKSFSQSSLFPSSISHSHLCSFYQVLLSILFIPIIHLTFSCLFFLADLAQPFSQHPGLTFMH